MPEVMGYWGMQGRFILKFYTNKVYKPLMTKLRIYANEKVPHLIPEQVNDFFRTTPLRRQAKVVFVLAIVLWMLLAWLAFSIAFSLCPNKKIKDGGLK